jgi:hypothetical protein
MAAAFPDTRLQARNPSSATGTYNVGLHDDSLAFSTLDGPFNGGKSIDWFFWPQVVGQNQQMFWKTSVMGGETRPELQSEIFTPNYQRNSEYKQDFIDCATTTHLTYAVHHSLFSRQVMGDELVNARRAHAFLGYNFVVTNVAAATLASSPTDVSIDVTVKQVGVAPFYYDLALKLDCGMATARLTGVDSLIERGQERVFTFSNIPADSGCLNNLVLTLESDRVQAGKKIKFAQGDGTLSISLPTPPNDLPSRGAPAPSPVANNGGQPTVTKDGFTVGTFSLTKFWADWLANIFTMLFGNQ